MQKTLKFMILLSKNLFLLLCLFSEGKSESTEVNTWIVHYLRGRGHLFLKGTHLQAMCVQGDSEEGMTCCDIGLSALL